MAWEIENTVNNAENQADFAATTAPQWEIENTQPMSQSVMDAEDQKTYNVPLGMDGIDAGFAIQTQHKGADKASFFGKVKTGIDVVGSSIEEVFQDFDRAVIEHAGQLTDSLILDKGLGYQRRMKRLEQWENGDWSFFGDMELSEERKKDIIQREKEHIETIRRWREKTQKFFNAGAQVMRPDEKLDSADKFFMAASSGIVSSAEAVGVSMITKNPTVAAASIAATYAALKDTEYFDKAIEAGETAENASRNAKIAASIEGGLEFVGDKLLLGVAKIKPIQQLGNKVINSSIAKLAKNAVGKTAIGKIASRHPASLWGAAVKGGFTEGTTELLQEGLGMGFENLTDVSNYSFDEILSQSLFAFGAGAIPGAGMGVVGTSIYNAKIKKDNAAIQTLLKENTPELTEQELQVVADNVQEALLQQGEEYENEFNKLLRKETEIDVMPDGLTKDSLKAETRQLLKDKYGMTDEDIDRTFDIAANFIDARNGFNETYNEYFDKMDAAGYERNTADAAARLLAARAVTIARQEGVSTEEVRKRWNLTLTRQNYADFKAGKPVNDRYAERLAQIEDVLAAVPESFTQEQKAALRKGLAARARFGDLDASNFNPETAAAWFEKMGGDGAVKAINKRVQAIMGIAKAQEELEAVKKSKKINPNELNPFEVLLDDKLYKKVAKIEKANKGDSLLAFIVKRGGLKDVGGDLKAMDAGKLRIGLINNKSGNSLDDIALAAWENGYFPNTQERPTINDLLEAISDELFGNPKYQYQDGNNESLIDYVDDLAEQMQILGVDYENMTADEAEQAYNAAADEYNKRRKEFEIPESDDGELFDDVLPLFQGRDDKLFKPSRIEKNNYIADLRAAEQAEGNVGKTIRLGNLPFVYREIGIPEAKVNTNKKTIIKDTIQKHAVPMEVVENLPDLYADPIMVFAALDKSTNKDAYVAVLDAFDKDGKQMIAAISPTKNDGGYHMITSFYGRNNIENMISTAFDEGKVKYVKDKKNSLLTGHNAHLSQTNNSIIEKSDIVNKTLFQLPAEAYNKQGKADVNSEAFKRWFGDSKVVDEKGQPLVVYHGGKKGIKAFSNKYALDENMFFFTSHEGLANEYRQYNETDFDKTDIYPVYLNITNPLILRGKEDLETMAKILHPENTELRQEWLEHQIQYTEEYIKKPKDWAWYLGSLALQHREEIKQYADKNGYDGILNYEPTSRGAFDEDYKGFIVFNPNQIKSVYNRGTFNPKSSNIYYQQSVISDEQLEADLAEFDKILDSFHNENKDYYDKKGKFDAARKLQKKYQDFFMYNIAEASVHTGQHDLFYFEYDGKKDIRNMWLPKKLEKNSHVILYRNAEQIIIPVSEFDASKFKKLGYKRSKRFDEGMRDIYTLDKSVKSDRPFFQSAFAGSRVDYDQPSLEAIGTGEGNQVHGFGLYYALNKDVAEGYRKRFVAPLQKFISFGEIKYNDKTGKYDNAFNMKTTEYEVYSDYLDAGKDFDVLMSSYRSLQNIDKSIKEKIAIAEKYKEKFDNVKEFVDESIEKGQVHEVEVPENPYLLDEDLPVNQQSDTVRKAVRDIMNKYPDDYIAAENYDAGSFGDALTGKSFYKQLMFIAQRDGIADKMGQMKFASKILEENGIKGITYDGQQDGRCFVIFNPADVRVIQKFYQGEEKAKVNPRGAFVKRGDENIIFAFENADASTVVHELGHFFLSDMKKFADNEKTAEQLAEIYKYLGAENGELTVEQEEKFADTFEVYLLDGRAPNQVLKSVFSRFKRWIGNLWAELKRIGGIEITDEVRSTFDEMFGGRSLDFSMQAQTLKMGQALERGNISQWQINRAMNMLYDGRMSKADMQTLINKLKAGMKGKEFVDALKEFENNPLKRNREALSEWDYTLLRNQLEGLNFNRDKVKNRIDKLLKWSEPRTRGGKLVGRFPNKQLNEAFDRYRELVAMEKTDAQNKIQENIELIEQQMKAGGDVDIERLIFENRLLSYGIGKISNAEMLKLYDGLAEAYNMGRLTDKITGEAKRERRRQMIERAKAVLTDGGRINPNIEVSELKQRLARFGMSQQSWSGLLDTLSVNDSSSKTNKSALSQDLDMFEAEQAKYAGVAADSESISEKLSTALKSSENPAQSVTRYINKELPKKTTLEWTGLKDPKERDPKRKKYIPFKRTFTKDQLIDIYMKAKDDDTRNIMINDPVNQYNREFLQKVDDELTSDDRAFADAVFKFYDENYTRFNAFYEAHFGMSLPKSKYYTPRAMTVDGVSIDDKSTHGYAGFSGAKKRVAEAGTAVINIQGVMSSLNKYINQQNHYMGYMDKLADINAVLANKEVKNIIGSLFGKEMNKRIEYEINNLANNGNDKIDVWGKFWNKVRANYAKSVLAVKPSLAIKQLTSFPAYWENISAPDFVAGVADFFAHPKEAIKTLGSTTLMKTRGADIIRDFDQITSGSLFNKMKRANGKIKWNDLLMANIQFGDRGAIYMGGWALYKSELKKNLAAGMSEQEAKAAALNAFERITDETQQSGRLSQQSYMQSNSALRAFTMFCSSQNQYLRKEINAVRGVLTGRMSKQQAAKTLFIYHVLLPVFFQVVSDGFRFDKDNDLRAAALGSLNGWFILNKVIENLYNLVVDEGNKMFKARMSVRDMIPFWGSVEDLKNNLLKFADDEMDAAEVIYGAIKPVGEVTGLPLKYAKDVAENAGDYAEDGEYGKELLLWLGWSPYSLMDSGE